MFEPLPAKFDFPAAEKRVLEFWEKHDIFGESLRIRAGRPRFVFYEGPPTANGMPHPGHCLTRAIKDLFPRYKTMCGYLVERKAGWDTHGLPVEVEVCRELGIHSKEEIEAYGVEEFVHRCIHSVWRYMREWEEMTRRLGFWVNLEDAYATYHQSYVESVWWSLKTLFERGLLYQGHKVVWWWCQGGTALSAGEVGEGYRPVDDPAVYVKFALVDNASSSRSAGGPHGPVAAAPPKRTSLLVWTTTPWTLVSNHFVAVGADIDYSLVYDPAGDEYLYIAAALVSVVAEKVRRPLEVVGNCKGADLLQCRYIPPISDAYYSRPRAFRTDRGFHVPADLPLGELRLPLFESATREVGDAGVVRHVGTLKLPALELDYAGWRVLAADFVTLDTGTGLVHEAPAFGEVDFNLWKSEAERFASGLPLLCAVNPDGTFNDDAPPQYRGRWVKDCDAEIIRELKQRTTPWGTPLLYHQETYRHDYPFCPRSEEDPLIQYARKSWFVRTSQFKDEFLKNNAAIRWLPEHIREGRFGDFLRNNVDWALSRERYWGTPLPIWRCEGCGKMEAIGSLAELSDKPGATDGGFWEQKVAEHAAAGDPPLPVHLKVHKPYIDEWTYDSPCCAGARMRRVSEVIDCWWDAGSMPFAQWGFPHVGGSTETFTQRFPADFISEAIDQTRGWFYGLLAISTVLFQDTCAARNYPHPFRTCVVLGLMMGEDGNKMSKRLRNYREPSYIFETYGADAMRWYFFCAQAPWTTTRFIEANIRDAQREFLVKLYNVLSFFNIYANIDGFMPIPSAEYGHRPTAQRCELDRWIISELHRTIGFVREKMDAFENYPAAQRLAEFVDSLSNWYLRRSRERFWRGEKDQDKWDAYHTLYGCLWTLSRLIAPFTPFFAETAYQNLVGRNFGDSADGAQSRIRHPDLRIDDLPLSVHLCDYPVADDALIDEKLAAEMDLVRDIVSLGRAARTAARLKVRQPLAQAEIILARPEHTEWLAAHDDLIRDELNIKRVEFTTEADHYVTYQIRPDFKAIGPKFGKLAPAVAAALAKLNAAEARKILAATGELLIEVEGQPLRLTASEVQVRLEARPGWSAAHGRAGVVVVRTELTPELKDEGLIRELIHHVQALRKDADLPYEARVRLFIDGPDALVAVVRRFEDVIRNECLAPAVEYAAPPFAGQSLTLEGHLVTIAVERLVAAPTPS